MIALGLSCSVFAVGLYGVLSRRDLIGVLISVELLLGAGGILIAAGGAAAGAGSGAVQSLALMVLLLAAAEAAVGLSLLLAVHRRSGRTRIDELSEVNG